MTTGKPNSRCYVCGEINCICDFDLSDEELDALLEQLDEYFDSPSEDEQGEE